MADLDNLKKFRKEFRKEKPVKSSFSQYRADDVIKSKVVRIIADKLFLNEWNVHPYSRLDTDLGADSLDAVEIIMDMEEEFDMTIPDEKAQTIRTVGDIITYIKEHQ